MAQTAQASSGLLDTVFGLGPFVTFLIAAHLTALLAWVVLLLRQSRPGRKTIKQQ